MYVDLEIKKIGLKGEKALQEIFTKPAKFNGKKFLIKDNVTYVPFEYKQIS